MTDPERPPSRAEFRTLARRVLDINKYGTRPLIGLTTTVNKIAADLAQLARDFEAHERRRVDRQRQRIAARRWIIGTSIAVLVALVAVLTLLLQLYGRIH